MPTIVDTKITQVTIYTDRALVTRSGTVALTGEERRLQIEQLPTTIDPESIRVSGRGEMAVKILGVNTDRQCFTEPVNAQVAEVTAQIENLTQQQQHLQTQIATAQMQADFITGLKQQAEETFSSSLARQKLSLAEALGFIDTIGDKFTTYTNSIASYRQQHQEIEKQLQVCRSRLQSLSTPHATESFQIVVDIESNGAGQFELAVSYVVNQASWQPLYDLRIDTLSKQLQLSYLAEITQRTGEDWQDVALTLSTAQPGLGTLPPQLEPWYIDLPQQQPREQLRRRQMEMASPAMAAIDSLDAPAGSFEVAPTAKVLVASQDNAVTARQGSVVTFQLVSGGNIPNDGSPHKTTIVRQELPCELNYVAMPSLVSFAYLQAQVQNPSEGATLLPGTANIFRDDVFVGSTDLDNVSPGQDFQLNLGIDEGIAIDRQLVERQVDKKFLGGYRRIVYAYRLKIRNLQTQAAILQLLEQVPHSRSEKIKVKLLKTIPVIALGELGRLYWEINLDSQQQCGIYYQFVIEYPEDESVIGLDI